MTETPHPESIKKNRFKPENYILIIIPEFGYKRVFSPDFDFHFTIPTKGDPNYWTSLTLTQAEKEIERRLSILESESLPHPIPKSWQEVIHRTPKDLIGIKEVAQAFMVSEATVRRMSERGEIKSYDTPGGHRRFSRSEIENKLQALQSK